MAKKNEAQITFKAATEQFDDAIEKSKKEMSELRAEFKLNQTQMERNGESVEALEKQHSILSAQLGVAQDKTAALSEKLQSAISIFGENSDEASKLRKEVLYAQAAEEKIRISIEACNDKLDEQRRAMLQVEDSAETLTETVSRQEKELSDLKRAYIDYIASSGTASDEAKALEKEISDLSGELKENKKKLQEASEKANELDGNIKKVEESTKDAAKGFTVLGGAMADLVADGISKTIDGLSGIASEAFDMSNDISKATNDFIAKTGESQDAAEDFENVMTEIYNGNYGESFEDIGQSLAVVKTAFDDIDNKTLRNITTDAIVLRDTFDFDVSESVRTAKSMMDNFGISAEEAYNLIAQGAQAGLNQNGDLLDVINEYSVQYKNAGYSAEDMFNMLANGVEAGTWSVDKLGDAVKELGIRAKDTSDSTADAFSALGYGAGVSEAEISDLKLEIEKLEKNLKYAKMEQANFNDKTSELTRLKNADKIKEYSDALSVAKANLETMSSATTESTTSIADLQERLGAGGETARVATEEIITALAGIEDPIKQNEIGVALFGTMWEDLGATAVFAMMDTQGEITKTKDVLSEINSVKYDDLGSALDGIKRNLQTAIAEPMQNEVMPAVNEFISDVDWQGVGDVVGNVFSEIATTLVDVAEGFKAAVEWGREHQGVLTLVAAAFGVLTTAITAYNVVQGVKAAMEAANVTTVWALVKAHAAQAAAALAAIAPYIAIVAAITTVIAIIVACIKYWDEIVAVVKYCWEAVKTTLGEWGAWIDINVIQPIVTFFTGLWQSLQEIWNKICDVVQTAFLLLGSIVSGAIQIITLPFQFIWENCKQYVFEAFEWISDVVSSKISEVQDFISTGFSIIRDAFSYTWDFIKNSIISPVWEGIKGIFSSAMDFCKNLISTGFNFIKEKIVNPITDAKTKVSEICAVIKDSISRNFNSAKDTVSNVWTNIKNAITKPIEEAKNKVKSVVDSITGFFKNMKISLPKIKLPHFKIKGEFSISPPSVPKLSIDWYKDGGIFTSPTIFPTVNGLKGVGEAGAEAVLPIDKLEGYIANVIERTMPVINLGALADKIDKLAQRPNQLIINGREFALATAGDSDSVNGLRNTLGNRGLILD